MITIFKCRQRSQIYRFHARRAFFLACNPWAAQTVKKSGGQSEISLSRHVGERAEREPMRQNPQQGPGAEPLVRRSGNEAPWSWKAFSFWVSNGSGKFGNLYSPIMVANKQKREKCEADLTKFIKVNYTSNNINTRDISTISLPILLGLTSAAQHVIWCIEFRKKLLLYVDR